MEQMRRRKRGQGRGMYPGQCTRKRRIGGTGLFGSSYAGVILNYLDVNETRN
jgi:hypothetical protein